MRASRKWDGGPRVSAMRPLREHVQTAKRQLLKTRDKDHKYSGEIYLYEAKLFANRRRK